MGVSVSAHACSAVRRLLARWDTPGYLRGLATATPWLCACGIGRPKRALLRFGWAETLFWTYSGQSATQRDLSLLGATGCSSGRYPREVDSHRGPRQSKGPKLELLAWK